MTDFFPPIFDASSTSTTFDPPSNRRLALRKLRIPLRGATKNRTHSASQRGSTNQQQQQHRHHTSAPSKARKGTLLCEVAFSKARRRTLLCEDRCKLFARRTTFFRHRVHNKKTLKSDPPIAPLIAKIRPPKLSSPRDALMICKASSREALFLFPKIFFRAEKKNFGRKSSRRKNFSQNFPDICSYDKYIGQG